MSYCGHGAVHHAQNYRSIVDDSPHQPTPSLPPSPSDTILLLPLLHICSSSPSSFCFISGRPRPQCNYFRIFAFFLHLKRSSHTIPQSFQPKPEVLYLIFMFSALATGRSDRIRPPGRKMKAIPPAPPPNKNGNFLYKIWSHCNFPRPSEPTPWHTLVYCHIFEGKRGR